MVGLLDKSLHFFQTVQLKTSATLTTAQTQQILQTIKQKYLPNANVLTPQQQVLLKQKGCVVQLQKSTAVTKNSSTGTGEGRCVGVVRPKPCPYFQMAIKRSQTIRYRWWLKFLLTPRVK